MHKLKRAAVTRKPVSASTECPSTPTSPTDESNKSDFPRIRKHHRDPNCRQDVVKELQEDYLKPVGGAKSNLNLQQLNFLEQHYTIIKNVQELKALPAALDQIGRGQEFGLVPLFIGEFVDETAQIGMFPMALDMGRNTMVFGPKCHVDRSFTTILKKSTFMNAYPPGNNDKTASDKTDETTANPVPATVPKQSIERLFDFSKLGLSRKLLKKLTVRVHFVVGKDKGASLSDLHQSLAMIRRQHGENWLCAPLRSCVQHMMMAPQSYKTSFYVLTVSEKGRPADVLACDMGYVVGDICTAFTGAYEVDGTGSVTLGASAKLLEVLEVPIWDLGMQMEYKANVLSSTTKKRKQWLATVALRKAVYEKEVAAVRSIMDANGSLKTTQWLHTPPNATPEDAITNAKCESPILRDPRKQALLTLLAAGVDADVLMGCNSAEDLFAKMAPNGSDALTLTGGTFISITPAATASSNINKADNDNASANNSKSQIKKAAKAAAIAEKKELKKQNGGLLPPKEVRAAASIEFKKAVAAV